jgi:hypothetical protein
MLTISTLKNRPIRSGTHLRYAKTFTKMATGLSQCSAPHARVKKPGKQPVGDNWAGGARTDPPRATVDEPIAEALNTGILCDGLRPVDIDIEDAAVAKQVRTLAYELLGDEPLVRTRGGSPRCVILYRAAVGEPPKRTVAGDHGKVEVVGRGEQFVAFGVHAESGSELNWNHGSPAHVPRDSLPAVTEGQVTAFLEAVRAILGPRLPNALEPAEPAPHPVDGPTEASSFRDVEAALKAIPDQDGDYDHWIRVGLATHAATSGSADGLNLFDHWSQKCPSKYDTDAVRAT